MLALPFGEHAPSGRGEPMKALTKGGRKARRSQRAPTNGNQSKRGVPRKEPRQSMTFAAARDHFDAGPGSHRELPESLVPVHGRIEGPIAIRGAGDEPIEEYYKWQFIYALIH